MLKTSEAEFEPQPPATREAQSQVTSSDRPSFAPETT